MASTFRVSSENHFGASSALSSFNLSLRQSRGCTTVFVSLRTGDRFALCPRTPGRGATYCTIGIASRSLSEVLRSRKRIVRVPMGT
jgi:hypothetical protein